MSDRQYPVASFMGCAGKVNGSFGVQESGAGLLYKYAPGVGEFYCSSFISTKQAKSMELFQLRQLPA